MVSRPATDDVVLSVAGPEAGAVHEYQTDAAPGLARRAGGTGSPASSDDSRLLPVVEPLMPERADRAAKASLAARAGTTTVTVLTGLLPAWLTAATPSVHVPGDSPVMPTGVKVTRPMTLALT